MNGLEEKRAYNRRQYCVPIEISYVHKGKRLSAESLNHCEGGMCFDSALSFQPGTTLNIRVIEFHPHGPCTGLCEGLRSIALAEVKWCSEDTARGAPRYQVGIQFLAPVY